MVATPVVAEAPRLKSLATPDTIRIGCIAMVEKNGEARRAEILSIKDMRSSGRHFYCNFDSFNKRLDEWVPLSRIDFSQEVEWPNPKEPASATKKKASGKRTPVAKKAQKRPGKRDSLAVAATVAAAAAAAAAATTDGADSGSGDITMIDNFDDSQSPTNASTPTTLGGAGDEGDEDDEDAKSAADDGFDREDELEKLRTSGSMTQNPTEVSRIRNINKVQFGEFDLYPWYFSPYPEAFSVEDVMYICEFCLSYYGDPTAFSRHRKKCTLLHPPGNEIYRDDYVSFFEIDGKRQRTWCRNLCLLSKMFLDHKTLYYDVDPFLFYVMTTCDDKGHHVVGYFSKEKESADGYNVACILTMPQYQRKGYGRLLIQFSYELSKIEGKLGSPEKPLSDLGLLSYRQYWSENILDYLMPFTERDERVTIEQISNYLSMTSIDVEHTLQALKMQVYHRQDHKIVIPTKLLEQRERQKLKPRRLVDASKIQWKPPIFTASSRTWGW